MASKNQYFIFHPEKASLRDLLSILFSNKSLRDYDFIDTNYTNLPPMIIATRLIVFMVLITSIICSLTAESSRLFENRLEYLLNYVYINGGLLGLIWHAITGSILQPDPSSADYRSTKSFFFGETDFGKIFASPLKYMKLLDDLQTGIRHQDTSIMELAILASTLAYENGARIKDTVNNQWKMNFVEFFQCWNVFIKAYSTQAFIFSDRPDDAQLIVVAFRGTEGSDDWKTNIDLSWITMEAMGAVHVGFMKALGLQNEEDFAKGFPKDYIGTETLAYYSIRQVLNVLLEKHKNAKILITGHSLGGALAILYPSLLVMHDQEAILSRISGVLTFGQPRVGDAKFGDFMVSILGEKYLRMVYRFDIVPRIPWEIPYNVYFKHFGNCISYKNWFQGKKVKEVPNKNYFNLLYWPLMYWGAIEDFFLSITWEIWKGEWEGLPAIFYRCLWIIFPGVAFHDTRDYTNAAMMAKVTYKTLD